MPLQVGEYKLLEDLNQLATFIISKLQELHIIFGGEIDHRENEKKNKQFLNKSVLHPFQLRMNKCDFLSLPINTNLE